MKAIILNSGLGTRMGSRTTLRPKCLAELTQGRRGGETTILSAQLTTLRELGVREIVMTTGFGEGILRSYVAQHFPELDVDFVMNPVYRETNYIYSLHLARRQPDDDVLLLHGDMVFEPAALERLLLDPAPNGAIVNPRAVLPQKDFKARVDGDCILEIGVELSGENCCALYPIYKLSPVLYAAWSTEIMSFVARGETGIYAEVALNVVLGREESQIRLAPVHFDGLCMEVDTVADLVRARRLYDERVASQADPPKRTPPATVPGPSTIGNQGGPR